MTKGERADLIRIAEASAKRPERDTETREQVLRVEVVDLMNAGGKHVPFEEEVATSYMGWTPGRAP